MKSTYLRQRQHNNHNVCNKVRNRPGVLDDKTPGTVIVQVCNWSPPRGKIFSAMEQNCKEKRHGPRDNNSNCNVSNEAEAWCIPSTENSSIKKNKAQFHKRQGWDLDQFKWPYNLATFNQRNQNISLTQFSLPSCWWWFRCCSKSADLWGQEPLVLDRLVLSDQPLSRRCKFSSELDFDFAFFTIYQQGSHYNRQNLRHHSHQPLDHATAIKTSKIRTRAGIVSQSSISSVVLCKCLV